MDEYPKHPKKPDTKIMCYLISYRGDKMVAIESRSAVATVCEKSGGD